MAFGRIRNNRRPPSSSSNVSAITIVVFIGFCVLGVWMLTSENNVVSPNATTRASTTTTTDEPSEIIKPDESTTFKKSVTNVDSRSSEDNPGDLPDDALKTGETQGTREDEKNSDQTSGKDLSKETTVGGSYPHNGESKDFVQENETRSDDNISKIDEDDAQSMGATKDSDESMLTEKQNIQQTSTNEQEINKKQQNQVEESRDRDQSGQRNEEITRKSNNQNEEQEQEQQQEQQEIEQEQKANEKQRVEDQEELESQQDKNQQRTEEDQQQPQQEGDKSITFRDETKKDSTEQETSEDSSTKQERDDTSQQEKPMARQQEDEAAKQQDSEQNTGEIQVTKQGTTKTTEPRISNSDVPQESNESKQSSSSQASQTNGEKQGGNENLTEKDEKSLYGYTWPLCNTSADYIPCLDNEKAVKKLRSRKHFQHRERHCPDDPPTCLVPTPKGYKKPVQWPESRDKIWFHNVPHPELAKFKGHQNWIKVSGEFLTFPGGGTQFIHGALHYIDFLQKTVPGIKWGRHTRVVLDVGCGVASFGGYLFQRDVLTMSFAPKDEHEAQVQFALERGIPAISAVMGTQRLPFPSKVFDAVHCARCRVPWHAEGGRLLLELNRILRPGGHFIWSATPVYRKGKEDVEIWEAMLALTASMCWRIEKKERDVLNMVEAAIFRKPMNNQCYDQRKENKPPMCKSDDDPDAAWYVPLQACMHRIPSDPSARGNKWPIRWAKRLSSPPYWLNNTQIGIYGKPALDDFERDNEHWQDVVNNSYLNELGIDLSDARNVMDMRAVYGGFAAALRNLQIWVLNVVNVNAPDTLPIIYERGLFGIYHDWCESFSTYPRTYDILHADHLFSKLKERCKLVPVMAEIDRIVRPGGNLIVRDESGVIGEVKNLLKSLHWKVHLTSAKNQVVILSATKSYWRPTDESP